MQPGRAPSSASLLPLWRAEFVGEDRPRIVAAPSPDGRIQFSVPGGQHELELNLTLGWPLYSGNVLTVLSLVLVAASALVNVKLRDSRKA